MEDIKDYQGHSQFNVLKELGRGVLRLSFFNPLTVNLGAEKLMDGWDFRIIGALLVLLDYRVHHLSWEASNPDSFHNIGVRVSNKIYNKRIQ